MRVAAFVRKAELDFEVNCTDACQRLRRSDGG